ncbi:hypothetical protein ACH5RR_025687 [Cinchona calisaya]|uniref:Uncharacterized protein n=1 Tax=Cinchona calisaya TaxID=153742 RepID=A0ABD2Z3Q8_9GENT
MDDEKPTSVDITTVQVLHNILLVDNQIHLTAAQNCFSATKNKNKEAGATPFVDPRSTFEVAQMYDSSLKDYKVWNIRGKEIAAAVYEFERDVNDIRNNHATAYEKCENTMTVPQELEAVCVQRNDFVVVVHFEWKISQLHLWRKKAQQSLHLWKKKTQ